MTKTTGSTVSRIRARASATMPGAPQRATRAIRIGAITALAAALAACGGGGSDGGRGALDESTRTAALTRTQIDTSIAQLPGLAQLIGAPSQCDVSQHKLVYESVDPKGESARASAGLLVPSGCPGPYPVVLYHHGTTVLRAFTMSDPQNSEASLQAAMFAAQGYVVVMPDYLGYGESDLGYHPYLQAENTAEVSIDALRAGHEALRRLGVATSGSLFLTGYSQGGHSTMATHRAIERDHVGEFTVTASAPMSGPYALEQTFVAGISVQPGQGASVFAPFTITGYQKTYGDLYSRPEEVFQAPWVSGITDLLPGTLGFTELYTTGKLPVAISGPGGLLTDSFVASFASPDNAFRKRLRDNDVFEWTPKAPVLLCAGSRDPVVTFQNVTTATAAFASRGVQVTPVDVEQVPAFQPVIAQQVAAAPDLSTYHGGIVPPLCLSIVKNQLFDPAH